MAQFALRHGLLDGGVMDDRVSIHADPSRISLASGGQQVLTIDAGRHRAGRSFLVLGSASGTEPSTSLHALPVPLVDDGYFQLTLAQPGAWIRYDGVLDENGRGRAIVAYPAGSDATLGTLHHACVLYQAFPLAFHAVSAAVALELTR